MERSYPQTDLSTYHGKSAQPSLIYEGWLFHVFSPLRTIRWPIGNTLPKALELACHGVARCLSRLVLRAFLRLCRPYLCTSIHSRSKWRSLADCTFMVLRNGTVCRSARKVVFAATSGDKLPWRAKLKAQEGKPIIAHGGASFARSLVARGLVDPDRRAPVQAAIGRPREGDRRGRPISSCVRARR